MTRNTHPLKRLMVHCSKHKSLVKKSIAYSILNKIFDLAPPLLIGAAVDTVVLKEKSTTAKIFSSWGLDTVMEQLILIAVLTVIIWAAESLFEYLLNLYWRSLAQEIQNDLRLETYDHLQKIEMSYFESNSSGKLTSILSDDINQLERFLDGGANDLLQVSTTVIIIGAIFFSISPLVATFSFIPVPLIIYGSFLFQRKIGPRYGKVRSEVGNLNSLLINNLMGMATIKSYGAESYELDRLDKQSRLYSEANQQAIKLSSSFSPLIRMVILVGFIFTLLIGGYQVESGILQVGAYSTMIFMTQRLLWPLTRLGATFDLYQRALSSVNRIFSLLDYPISISGGEKKMDVKEAKGHIEFRNVSFSYEAGTPILKNVSFTITPGGAAALVGATGSGKSTIMKLLLRFYDPEEGSILLDGVDIKEYDLANLRATMAYVGQDTYLFHGTVAENIKYGRFSADHSDMQKVVEQSHSHDFIKQLPNQFETIVGERGQKLSGGQRQRISIARALLKSAPVFLFDEATSAVDNETEASIQLSLGETTKGKTTLAVAHRLSTIKNSDQIYVLHQGEIIERGTHDELLDNKSQYYTLWNVQAGNAGIIGADIHGLQPTLS